DDPVESVDWLKARTDRIRRRVDQNSVRPKVKPIVSLDRIGRRIDVISESFRIDEKVVVVCGVCVKSAALILSSIVRVAPIVDVPQEPPLLSCFPCSPHGFAWSNPSFLILQDGVAPDIGVIAPRRVSRTLLIKSLVSNPCGRGEKEPC